MDDYRQVLELLAQPLDYSERAKREMEQAHFTEAMLLDLLQNPKSVEGDDAGFVVRARKTSRIKLKITQDKTVLIEDFSYNPVPFVF